MRSGFPLVALFALAWAAPAWAYYPGPFVSLHITTPVAKNPCTTNAPTFPCSQFVVEAPSGYGATYHVYLVVAHADPRKGIAGVTTGIGRYGIDIWSWTRCADFEFQQDWPANGGGNAIFWDAAANCQRTDYGEGAQAVAGYFYMSAYAPGELRIVEHPSANLRLKVLYCTGETTGLTSGYHSARAAFPTGGYPRSYNPCADGVPVDVLTWGRIKAAYRRPEGD